VDERGLACDDLSVGYDGAALIEQIELEVKPGRIVTLIGPNGAGKSTILKTLAGSLPSVAGRVYLSGKPLDELTSHERALEMSVMLTERLTTELLTCADIVEAGRYPHTGRLGVLDDNDRAAVDEAMRLVAVKDLSDRDFMHVSDGQRQRVLLARAICQEPAVLLLDEPTSYLDIKYQIDLLRILRTLADEKQVAIVMSLHELQLARIVSDEIVCIKGPRVFASGTPEEMFVPQVIDDLYDLPAGCYDPATGAVTLSAEKSR
jgi:iron complex transport system ATP-binding protein